MKDETKEDPQLADPLETAELRGAESDLKWTDETLRALVEGTASATGEDFFRSLVRNLATALRVRYAFVSEFTAVNTRVRTLAFWAGEGFLDNFEYDIADTPCEQVLCGEMRHYRAGVQALFPKDEDLIKLGAESYLAIPLIAPLGMVLGHLAVIDDKAMPGELRDISIFKIFGARAGAELERQRAEAALRKARDELERRVEERTAELREINVSLQREVTERQRAEAVLRKSEERYRALYEDNPSIYFTVNPDGTILSVNPFGAEQLGYTVDELVRQSILNVFDKEDTESVLRQLTSCVQNPTQVAHWEFRKVCKDGSRLWVREAARAISGTQGETVVLIVCEDITERKRAEEALRESKRRLEQQNRALVELTKTGTIGRGDLEVALKVVTEAAAKTLQVERVGVWLYNDNRSMIRCIEQYELSVRKHTRGAELAAADHPSYFQALEENRAIDAHDAHTDPRTSEFSERYLSPHGITSMLDAPIRVGGEMVGIVCHEHVGVPRRWILEEQSFAGSIADVVGLALETHERQRAEEALRKGHDELERRVEGRTAALSKTVDTLEEQVIERKKAEEELRRSEEQLRALSTRLLSAQEEERTRLAREIHDELGAALTALRIDVALVGQRLPGKEKVLQKKIQAMTHLVDGMVQAVRRIATALRPGVLDHLGLVAALQWQVREFQERTGIVCVFTRNPEDITVDSPRATTVFRICQEALTNVARHANATRIDLSLCEVGTDLVLEVRDNGRGISEDAIADPKSFGLMGMRERVVPWGGEVLIRGVPGEGTVVRVLIPTG